MPRPQNEKENLQFVQELAEIDGPFESPININFRDLTKLELPPLVWNRSDTVPKKMKLTNTGHTVILSGRWNRERPYLTGGPLDGNYVFSQVHFHWGPDNCRGSEHTVCGEKFPLEMHVAHFKTEYLTQEAALQEKDGMVVLVYLFKLQEEPNLSLKRIIGALSCIREASTSTQIDARSILALLNPFTDDYFMYWGSVVTNTCAHILLWIICREPFGISKDQLAEFRKVMDTTLQPILRNNREPQPLHGRNVFHVNASRHLDKAMLPIKKIMGCFCNEQNDGMGDEEGNDTKRRQSSCRCCCNKSRPQEDIEDKKSEKSQDQKNGTYSRHMVYVQHATVPYNHAFRQKTTQEEPPPDRGQGEVVIQEEISESTEKQEISESCCFLPVKECKKIKTEKDTAKEKPKKKSFDSVKALSNIIDSLEALKNHTYKKLQELDAINTEIKELKKHCEDANEQRWLRKMERIISRQKRYTLRTSRCCFSELKRLAKEYHIDKILEGRIVTSTEDDKIFTINENEYFESPEISEGSKNNQVATCYSLYKQERFSKKAQKLIKSFFEDIKENEEAEQSVQKDLHLRKISKYRLDDEISRTGASSVDGSSKNYITQQMFNLGDFGHRFFTEVTPEKEEISKEVKKQKDDKIIPLRRADILFKYKNKHRALKKSSASSLSVLIVNPNASEKKVMKKKPKKVKETLVKKYKKKIPQIQYVTYTSDGTSNDEMLITKFTKQRSRKDLWENPSTISIRPMITSAKKKKIIIEKSLKKKLKQSKKESKREQEIVVETIKTMSEATLSPSEREICKACQESPERKIVKVEHKRNEDLLAVCRYEEPRFRFEEHRVKYEEPKVKSEETRIKYEEPTIKYEENRVKQEEPRLKSEERRGKPEEPRLKSEERRVKHEEPRLRSEERKVKHEEPRLKSEERKIKHEEPRLKSEEHRVKPEEPRLKSEERRVKPKEPRLKSEERKVKPEEPRIKHEEPKIKYEEPQVKLEEPHVKHEDHVTKNEEHELKYKLEEIKATDEESDRTTVVTSAIIGDSLMKNKPITPLEFSQECEEAKLKAIGEELSKRSWAGPTSMIRDVSAEKRRLFVAPKREKSIQRRATSPVIVYHTTDSSENPPPTLHRYEIHDHDNTEKTFNQSWSSESKLSNHGKQQLLEKELFNGETYANGTDSNDSTCDKASKSVKSDVTIFSIRSSENDERRIRKDGKSRTMSAFSFNSARAMYHKKRKHRQMHKNKSTPSTVRVLDTIESSRLEFSHLTEEEQLQIISANVASFVKQKLLEHKKGTDDEDDENKEKSTFEEIEKNVLKELQTGGDSNKKDDEDSDTLENRWSTAVLKVPSMIPLEKPKLEVKEVVEEEPKKPPPKQTHNFIKRNKMLAGKYKRKNPQKKQEGPKKLPKPSVKSTTEPTSSDKSPTRAIKPHACGNVVKSPEEKAKREKSITAPKNPRASSASKKPMSPDNEKRSPERKTPESRDGGTRLVPTSPSAVVPKKRWVPTYTLTSYLQAPTEVMETQQRKLDQCYLRNSEDENDMKLTPFNLQTNDLEYLIKLEMCISNEIAANIENSMNYVKTLLSQDYNGTAIIEKPPVKDSFNIFNPVNSGILLIELNDCLQSDSTTGASDGIYRCSIQSKKLKKKKRKIRRKWSDLYRKSDSGEQSCLDSEYSKNDSDGEFGRNKTEAKDVSKILEKYIYHLGRGEESNINLTEKTKASKTEEVNQISKIKPHLRRRNEKLLLSVDMKDKLLEVLTEEMRREIEDKQKSTSMDSASVSSPETTSTGTPSNVICECDRTELWAEMLRKFLQDNKNIIEGNEQGKNYSETDSGQGLFKDC